MPHVIDPQEAAALVNQLLEAKVPSDMLKKVIEDCINKSLKSPETPAIPEAARFIPTTTASPVEPKDPLSSDYETPDNPVAESDSQTQRYRNGVLVTPTNKNPNTEDKAAPGPPQ